MIRPIVAYGSPVLRETAVAITPEAEDLDQLITDMWETMYHANGGGLAAPQIGLSIRLIVIDASFMADEEPELKSFKKTLINPRILWRNSDYALINEGCLSLPSVWEDINRPNEIRIHYTDENWVEHEEEYAGFAARVIQHEYDHLEGILFIDHLSILSKRLLSGKLKAISRGKVKTSYKLLFPNKLNH